ncbi:MAG TPA: type II toxin-antitoxin system VapC family toxin [Capsulimonadaceae bacterium]|jgi:tRNA(fMet)-specific endonuclease VapC
MKYLLDTNVLSAMIGKTPDHNVVSLVSSLPPTDTYISVISIGEICRGIAKMQNGRRRQELTQWLHTDLLTRSVPNILPMDTNIMMAWGNMTANLERQGRPLPLMDSLIAAVALVNNCTLVTRNESDFAGTNITLLNPWK